MRGVCGGVYICVCMSAIDVLCLIHVVAFVPRYVYDVEGVLLTVNMMKFNLHAFCK